MNSTKLVNVGMSFPMTYRISVDKAIGITTTIPIEIVYAADLVPIDLNNIFICNEEPDLLVDYAEIKGLPRNTCAWIKGIYSATKKTGIKKIIGVVQGDCSNNQALIEVLKNEGIEVIPFSFPHDKNRNTLYEQLDFLSNTLGTNLDKAHQMKLMLDSVRRTVHEIDRLTWEEDKVTGEENHIWNVSTSDLMGDYRLFERKSIDFLKEVKNRPALDYSVRLGYIGVPPICYNLYSYLEKIKVHVVFNEVQRQFSMPYQTDTLIDQYISYTYPYDMLYHIEDIKQQIAQRKIDGIIHYVQNFCHRHIYDKLIRKHIDIPVLTLDCDRPGQLSGSMKTRIEAFVEMLKNTRC